mmetsp:Transcript_18774/g.48888  ORF Transcript_18774/g.48888 Transcript_18774/m.48888 type:complete len:214 (-) Transcript_18774:390-1031(-)
MVRLLNETTGAFISMGFPFAPAVNFAALPPSTVNGTHELAFLNCSAKVKAFPLGCMKQPFASKTRTDGQGIDSPPVHFWVLSANKWSRWGAPADTANGQEQENVVVVSGFPSASTDSLKNHCTSIPTVPLHLGASRAFHTSGFGVIVASSVSLPGDFEDTEILPILALKGKWPLFSNLAVFTWTLNLGPILTGSPSVSRIRSMSLILSPQTTP